MHAYFRVLEAAVAGKPLPREANEGAITFRVMGLDAETFRVELRRGGCRTSTEDGPAELMVWASRRTLDAMLAGAPVSEPLRVEGDASLLDVLARCSEPGLSALNLRAGSRP